MRPVALLLVAAVIAGHLSPSTPSDGVRWVVQQLIALRGEVNE